MGGGPGLVYAVKGYETLVALEEEKQDARD